MTHPFVQLLFDETIRQDRRLPAVCRRAGVSTETVQAWRRPGARRSPYFLNMEAMLGALDLRLVVEPIAADPIPFMRWSARR